MGDNALIESVKEICAKDPRFHLDSYLFVLESLEFTAKMLNKPNKSGRERHVAGRELLEGVRHFALQEYGPMALTVLSRWGIERTEDVGEIVFNLVDAGKLRQTEEDSKSDFANGFDFSDAFVVPFLPESGTDGPSTRAPRNSKDPQKRQPGTAAQDSA